KSGFDRIRKAAPSGAAFFCASWMPRSKKRRGLAKLRTVCPYDKRLARSRLDRRHAVQKEGRKGDEGAARPGRRVDRRAELELQVAAFVGSGLGKLEAERELARRGTVRAAIDVPAVMAALA